MIRSLRTIANSNLELSANVTTRYRIRLVRGRWTFSFPVISSVFKMTIRVAVCRCVSSFSPDRMRLVRGGRKWTGSTTSPALLWQPNCQCVPLLLDRFYC